MLKEKIHYSYRLPLNVNVINVDEYPIHFHDDLEILFVLEGSIILKNGYYSYKMNAGDIFILNDREIHSFKKASIDNLLLMFQINKDYFINHYPNLDNSFFVTDMEDPDDRDLEVLRELLASAIMQAHSGSLGYEQKLIEIAHNVLSCLMENFQYFAIEDGRFVNEVKNKSNKILAARMNRVSHYIYENYSRKLTLKEIADREHLSIYHLSHVIKASTGLSFKELLGFIRVEESEKFLLGTDMNINEISEAVGFSATRYYVEHFKKWFEKNPQTYRREYSEKVSGRKTPAVMKKVNKLDAGNAVKKNYPDVYYDYHKKDQPPGQVLDININIEKNEEIKETPLYKTLTKQDTNHSAQLLSMLTSLKEPVVASGENFIATCGKSANSISILTCSINSEFSSDPYILVRISDILGKYSLKRIVISAQHIETGQEARDGDGFCSSRRQKLFDQLDSLPVVENSIITAVNTLNLVLSLPPLSGELLLLDKIQE